VRLLSFRLIISLIVGITLVSLLFSYYEVRAVKATYRQDLQHNVESSTKTLSDSVESRITRGSHRELQRIVDRFGTPEHLSGVAIYDKNGNLLAVTQQLSSRQSNLSKLAEQAVAANQTVGGFPRWDNRAVYVSALPLHDQEAIVGSMVIVRDASYIDAQTRRVWRETFLRALVEVFLIVLITLLIVRWSIAGPIAKAAQWMKALRTGRNPSRPYVPDIDLLRPLTREMATFAESLNAARTAAETEAQLREAGESLWTAERLSVHVRGKLGDSHLFVVSNREPYLHTRQGKTIQAVVPASGLVTALEPVLCACDGTWIAHGSGDADREMVDAHDRLRVPPEEPRYSLRRVWLSKEEEEGYYYGFANEGPCPLCHIAHAPPISRA